MAGLKYALAMLGEQCVMITGIAMMHGLCADS